MMNRLLWVLALCAAACGAATDRTDPLIETFSSQADGETVFERAKNVFPAVDALIDRYFRTMNQDPSDEKPEPIRPSVLKKDPKGPGWVLYGEMKQKLEEVRTPGEGERDFSIFRLSVHGKDYYVALCYSFIAKSDIVLLRDRETRIGIAVGFDLQRGTASTLAWAPWR
jgi:hypothetical protein